MLDYATAVAIKLSDEVAGCRILTVDSKKNSVDFYKKYGFQLVNCGGRRNTIPLYKDILGTRMRA